MATQMIRGKPKCCRYDNAPEPVDLMHCGSALTIDRSINCQVAEDRAQRGDAAALQATEDGDVAVSVECRQEPAAQRDLCFRSRWRRASPSRSGQSEAGGLKTHFLDQALRDRDSLKGAPGVDFGTANELVLSDAGVREGFSGFVE